MLGVTEKSEQSLEDFKITELIGALEADNLIERITHRKQANQNEQKTYIKLKGTQQ